MGSGGDEVSLTAFGWVVCLLDVFGSIFIGLRLAMRSHASESSEGSFLAGRRLTWPIIGASLFATNIGTEQLVGLSGDSYRYGMPKQFWIDSLEAPLNTSGRCISTKVYFHRIVGLMAFASTVSNLS